MSRWFTPQERGVILFLVAVLLVGAVVYIYKSRNPYFAPELKILESEEWAQELEDSEGVGSHSQGKEGLGQLIQGTRTKLEERTWRGASVPRLPSATEMAPIERKININTASENELITLPGIGSVLAQRIIEYRKNKSGFKNTEDIMKVRGIGEKKFEKLKDKITVE